MKIMISGSMTFVHAMLEAKKELEEHGHEVTLPYGMEPHLKDGTFTNNLNENLAFCIEDDVMLKNFKQIETQDAVFVFNKEKNNIPGYIGVSTLMEMAIAKYLGKKLFVLHKIPHFNEQRWAHEVSIMQPIILDGELSKIN